MVRRTASARSRSAMAGPRSADATTANSSTVDSRSDSDTADSIEHDPEADVADDRVVPAQRRVDRPMDPEVAQQLLVRIVDLVPRPLPQAIDGARSDASGVRRL